MTEEHQKPLSAFELDFEKVKYPLLPLVIKKSSYQSLSKFCQANGLNKTSLHNLIYGKSESEKLMILVAKALNEDSRELFIINPYFFSDKSKTEGEEECKQKMSGNMLGKEY